MSLAPSGPRVSDSPHYGSPAPPSALRPSRVITSVNFISDQQKPQRFPTAYGLPSNDSDPPTRPAFLRQLMKWRCGFELALPEHHIPWSKVMKRHPQYFSPIELVKPPCLKSRFVNMRRDPESGAPMGRVLARRAVLELVAPRPWPAKSSQLACSVALSRVKSVPHSRHRFEQLGRRSSRAT